jgi:hypothetical protein
MNEEIISKEHKLVDCEIGQWERCFNESPKEIDDNVEIKPREIEHTVSLTKLQIDILSEIMEDEIRAYFEDPYHEECEKILVKLKGEGKDE